MPLLGQWFCSCYLWFNFICVLTFFFFFLMCYQEDETKTWKKMINIAVSGAAGMISNHLLFKVRKIIFIFIAYLSLNCIQDCNSRTLIFFCKEGKIWRYIVLMHNWATSLQLRKFEMVQHHCTRNSCWYHWMTSFNHVFFGWRMTIVLKRCDVDVTSISNYSFSTFLHMRLITTNAKKGSLN